MQTHRNAAEATRDENRATLSRQNGHFTTGTLNSNGNASAPEIDDPATALTTILSKTPIDLCRVADEMHAHPELEAMILRLASSMLLLPESSVSTAGTIEEAVVALGADRIRSLLQIWSALRPRRSDGRNCCPEQWLSEDPPPPPRSAGALIPEALYLATFLRYADCDLIFPAAALTAALGANVGRLGNAAEKLAFPDLVSSVSQIATPLPKPEESFCGPPPVSPSKDAE